MSEITLEKIDIIRERTNVSYAEAKKALETCDGNVVDALIYIEENEKSTMDNIYTTKDEFLSWIKDIVDKGNVNRIRIKKDDKVVVDIPVNAGIAASLTALVWPPLIAIGILTAVVTRITIEITKSDGSVEVINKTISSNVKDVKDKVMDAANSVKENVKDKFHHDDENHTGDGNTYKYTVKFDDIDEKDNEKKED
ncbi:DUF4342 domain-containing protein [Clostridium fermenticellae]|uniref:DUF4342 domain-containing protein n=1 Tax=Clostridium fermenticellae TaxID=2068654 RepID=A0A386H5E7_9CLOT|nr:DUF4342 domain-containing protein [Clostridium fermenticellae]AYD40971.1 DUF4342 domain-containing protein [Clostridium fermenticellae]